MKMIPTVLIMTSISIIGCEKNQFTTEDSFFGFWEVIEMIYDEVPVNKESPTDSILIEFQADGIIMGRSSRNTITGHYKLFENDSIWISYLGGTEVNNTNWESKFRKIMPLINFSELRSESVLMLYSSDRKNQIVLDKYHGQ